MYLGTYALNEYLVFAANTHNNKGQSADATSIAYRIYEEDTEVPLKTGSMAKFDDANTLGFYLTKLQLLAADGFENGKTYTVFVSATVQNVPGTASHIFRMAAAGAAAGDKMDLIDAPNSIAVTAIQDGLSTFSPDDAAEVGITFRQSAMLANAMLAGLAAGGGVAGDKTFKSIDGDKTRITMTTDVNGNRTVVTFDFDNSP